MTDFEKQLLTYHNFIYDENQISLVFIKKDIEDNQILYSVIYGSDTLPILNLTITGFDEFLVKKRDVKFSSI